MKLRRILLSPPLGAGALLALLALTSCAEADVPTRLNAPTPAPAPAVTETLPTDGAFNVPTNTNVAVIFDTAMTPIDASHFSLSDGENALAGAVTMSADGRSFTFDPLLDLKPTTMFEGAILAGAASDSGVAIVAAHRWSFTTGVASDLVGPEVASTSPVRGSTGVATNQLISATFTELMDPATIGIDTFTLDQGETPVPGSVVYSGVTALFIPAEELEPNTVYSVTIGTDVTDLAGNPLQTALLWSFTTGESGEQVAPTVVSTTPELGARGVPTNQHIGVTFSEPMDPTSISAATFTLRQGATPIVATVTYSGVSAFLAAWETLEPNTEYTVTLSTAAVDLAGNPLESAYEWRFTTGGQPDSTRPTVVSSSPLAGMVGVAINQPVTVTFGERMNPTSISTATLTMRRGVTPIAATVTYAGLTATLTPWEALAYDTEYTVTLSIGAVDLAGNALESAYEWRFTTGTEPDTTAPGVESTTPADLADLVEINVSVSATFSEALALATVTSTTMTLTHGATPVAGAVSYSGDTATLVPVEPLEYETEYTATFAADILDLAGNPLSEAYVWRFTTRTAPDLVGPEVASTSPVRGSTGVATNQLISATFTELMDPATIGIDTFTVDQGETPVLGSVVYSGVTALFMPTDELEPSMVYSVTIGTDVTDLAGNPLQTAFLWSFTTGESADRLAPTVASNTPELGATDVPTNQRIGVTFSEPMDPASISAATFTLRQGATPIDATVTYSGVSAFLAPWEALEPNIEYTVTLSTAAIDLAGNALESAYEWRFTTGGQADLTRPAVVSTSPPAGTVDVATNQAVSMTFSEPMDPTSISAATLTMRQGVAPIAATVTYAGLTATLTPWEALAYDTEYTVTLSVGAVDLAGNALESAYEWRFTTGTEPDTTPPGVESTTPADLAELVEINVSVSATFSEALALATVTSTTMTLTHGATPVAGAVSYFGDTATLAPVEPLEYETEYTATLTVDILDLAGNPLSEAYVWRFTTGAEPDLVGPEVASTSPVRGSTGVATNQFISATFTELMDPTTIGLDTFTLDQGETPVLGSVAYSGVTALFIPAVELEPGTVYSVRIEMDVTDLAGNPLQTAFLWSFTTGESGERVPPTVVSNTPGIGAVDVPINQRVSMTFSEPMDPTSISAATFTLRQGATPVVATVTYSGVSAFLAPWEVLEPNTEYTVTLSIGAVDLAGNPLESAYEWRFTTGDAPDSTAPTVVSASPPAGTADVAIDQPVTVRFSEPMTPISISAATLTMRRGVTPIAATVTYAGLTATLTPWEALAYDTEYTVTLSVGAVDLAGNALESAYEWRFTTGTEPDTTPPGVESTTPADLAELVEINVSVSATFSEALALATVTSTTMTLTHGATPVAGAVSYFGDTATLAPVEPLEYETEYTATLTVGILDLAGNPLSEAYVWRFTTRTAPDTIAPTVSSASPSSGEVGAAPDQGVTVTFSEPMAAASVTTSTFSVTDASSMLVAGAVTLDATGTVATLTPIADLARGTTYEVVLSTGLTDLAGNPLAADVTWTWTTAAGPPPVSLGTAAQYVILARTGIATTGVSDVTGDLGLSPGVDAVLLGWGQSAATTFSTSPLVDGRIYVSTYAAPTPDDLSLASSDMGAAYVALAAQGPPDEIGLNAGALGGVTFGPGIYRWAAAATIATDVTIDGGPNDVWVFQINGALAMAASVSVILTGGASPSNVFWQVNGAINIGATSHFEGIALASTAINVGAGSSVNGRLLAQTAVSIDTCDIALTLP